MTVGKAIYYLLNNSTDLEAVVGTRIFPEVAAQDTALPFAMYSVISNEPSDTHSGPSLLDVAQVDVVLYNTSYTGCVDMGVYVRAALDRVTGTYNGVNVQSCQYNSEVIDFDEYKRAYVITQSYDVRISRTEFEIAQGTPVTGALLGDLYDVTDNATTGQVIIKQADGTWAGGDAAGALGDLTDVASDVTSEAIDRHALVYDEDSGEWIPRYPGEIRVINQSGETLLKGQLATATGAQGDQVVVQPYNSQDDWRYLVGIATEEMAHGESGHVITLGEVRGLDTDQFNVGDLLYPTGLISSLSPFGLTKFGETAGGPDNPLPIAICTRSHKNTGRIQVRMWTPGHVKQLAGLSDVNVPAPYVGAILKYVQVGSSYFWGYLPQTSKSILDGATEDVEIYYYAEGGDTQLDTNALSDTPSAGNKIVRKIWYTTSSQADPDADVWTLYSTLDDNATFAELEAAFEASLLVSPTGGQPVSIKTTWEEVSEFTGLLDDYPGAAVAISLRLLDADYTGNAIQVRRASDSTTQDIGFDANGDLDTSALATFCAGTDGYVATWYDQSGNGNNLTQATTSAQPQIVASGSYLNTIRFNGSTHYLSADAAATSFSGDDLPISQFMVLNTDTNAVTQVPAGFGNSSTDNPQTTGGFIRSTNNKYAFLRRDDSNSSGPGLQEGTASIVVGSDVLLDYVSDGTEHSIALNGVEDISATVDVGTMTVDRFTVGALSRTSVGAYFDGDISELILYPSDQSSNRTGIEANINDFYSIY